MEEFEVFLQGTKTLYYTYSTTIKASSEEEAAKEGLTLAQSGKFDYLAQEDSKLPIKWDTSYCL